MKLFYRKRESQSLAVRTFTRTAGLEIEEIELLPEVENTEHEAFFSKFNQEQETPFLIIEKLQYGIVGGHTILRYLADYELEESKRENFAYPQNLPKSR